MKPKPKLEGDNPWHSTPVIPAQQQLGNAVKRQKHQDTIISESMKCANKIPFANALPAT